MSTIKVISIENGSFFSKVDGQLVKINIGDTLPKDVQIESATTNNEESKLNLELENGELITITNSINTNLEDFLLANSRQDDVTNFETASGDKTQDETEAGEEEATDDGAFRGTFNDRDGDATDIVSDLRDASFVENRVLDENDELDVIALEDAEPIIPEVPIEPEIPEIPEEPIVPEPVEPQPEPEIPTEPEEPEVPEIPEEPEVPETPEEPENPENPETPEEPENPENPETPEEPETPEVPATPIIKISGNIVIEEVEGNSTNKQVIGTITAEIINGVTSTENIVISLDNGETITIPAGFLTGSTEVDTTRKDDYYFQGQTQEDFEGTITSGNATFEDGTTTSTATITINDDIDPVRVIISATATTETVITKDNLQNNAGFTVKAFDPDGNEAQISTHDNPSGFGVLSQAEIDSGKVGQSNQVYSGHTSEIGMTADGKSETIEVTFNNPIQTLDVAFAWRATQESAKVDFYDANGKVGHAIIFGGDGSEGSTTIQYFDASGNPSGAPQMVQGGTDKVDLVYTFKPAGDVPFTKAVFSAIDNNLAFGQQSDYLIHSIKYKEVNDGETTTIIGSNEVAFKIETSVKPDPSFINPTADVKIVDNLGNILFEGTVNLDANGKAIVSVRTDGTLNLTATVTNVKGNFEAVDYTNNEATISATIIASAEDDTITLNEDTQYILAITDFGDSNQNIAQVKFNTVPENGKIYVLKTEYTGSMNDRAEYTSSENKVYVELKADDIVDISKIEEGSLIFVPNENTDNSGSFTFSVSNGNGIFNGDYTTTININAVADAPVITLDIEQVSIHNQTVEQVIENFAGLNHHEKTYKLFEKGWTIEGAGKMETGNYTSIFEKNEQGQGRSHMLVITDPKNTEGFTIVKTPEFTVNDGDKVSFNFYGGSSITESKFILTLEKFDAQSGEWVKYDKDYYDFTGMYREKQWAKVGDSYVMTGGTYSSGASQTLITNELDSGEYRFVYTVSDLSIYIDDITLKSHTEELAYKYEIDIEAALTDTDGSERLEVYLKNLPEDSKLFDKNGVELEANTSGKYSIELDSGEAKLTLISSSEISDIDLNSIKASAVAIEESNSDSFTTTTTINQILGSTIELTGLKELLDDQGHIDLKLSESKDNVTLTLKDLIELKGANDIIKISGDKFDSVQLKNEDNHTWEKAEESIIDGDSIYDVYIGYIDDMHSIQVHIEQHISDGITN